MSNLLRQMGAARPLDTVAGFQQEAVLAWYDGPLQTLLRAPAGAYWIATWVDTADAARSSDRWLYAPLSSLLAATPEAAELLAIIQRAPTVLLVDEDASGVITAVTELPPADLPADYLPDPMPIASAP